MPTRHALDLPGADHGKKITEIKNPKGKIHSDNIPDGHCQLRLLTSMESGVGSLVSMETKNVETHYRCVGGGFDDGRR